MKKKIHILLLLLPFLGVTALVFTVGVILFSRTEKTFMDTV